MADVVLEEGLGLGPSRRGVGRRAVAAMACAVVALAGLGACGGDGDGDGDGGSDADPQGASVPDDGEASSSTTTTTTPSSAVDITKKPDTVTVEYADAVMDELDRILSDAIREFVAADGPTKGFDDKLNAVYDEPSLENARQEYGSAAANGMDAFKRPPGDVTTTVKAILKQTGDCVVLEVERDFGPTLVAPRPDARTTGYVALEPTDADGDPADQNTTPWSIVFDGNVLEGEEPRNAC